MGDELILKDEFDKINENIQRSFMYVRLSKHFFIDQSF